MTQVQSWREQVEAVLGFKLTDDQAKKLFWWVTSEHQRAINEFAAELETRLTQELNADGIHQDDWPDEPRAQLFDLIEEVRKENT